MGTPDPGFRPIQLIHLGSPPDLFKLVQNVAHTSTGKWAVGLPLKALLLRVKFLSFIWNITNYSFLMVCVKLRTNFFREVHIVSIKKAHLVDLAISKFLKLLSKIILKTKMHSSRMRTDPLLTVYPCCRWGGRGCIHAAAKVHLGGCIHAAAGAVDAPSPPCEQNDTCLWKHYLPRFATLCGR